MLQDIPQTFDFQFFIRQAPTHKRQSVLALLATNQYIHEVLLSTAVSTGRRNTYETVGVVLSGRSEVLKLGCFTRRIT